MKSFLISTLIVLGVAAPATAGDLAARQPSRAAADVAAVSTWSGLYLGVNAGYGRNRDHWSGVPDRLDFGSHLATGALGGGQIGYRLQSGALVVGLEAAGDWAGVSGHHLDARAAPFVDHSRLNALGLFTGQAGYAWKDALLYAKAGAAVADLRWESAVDTTHYEREKVRWGATVGAGLEYGFAPNWSIGLEYDHLFLARHDESLSVGPCCTPFSARVGGDVDLVTARINYRFGSLAISRP
jgi:outer membrane immunogenic protein